MSWTSSTAVPISQSQLESRTALGGQYVSVKPPFRNRNRVSPARRHSTHESGGGASRSSLRHRFILIRSSHTAGCRARRRRPSPLRPRLGAIAAAPKRLLSLRHERARSATTAQGVPVEHRIQQHRVTSLRFIAPHRTDAEEYDVSLSDRRIDHGSTTGHLRSVVEQSGNEQ